MMRNVCLVLLPALALCFPRPGDQKELQELQEPQEPSIKLGHLKIQLFPFPHLVSNDGDNTRRRVGGFFSDNPLISVKRSFQDIQTNVEKSMQSLLAAGSAIGQRMLGMITRSPRVLLSPQQPVVARPPHIHHNQNFPDFNNCDCHFSGEDLQPYTSDLESYGAPAAPLVTLPQSDSPTPDPAVDLTELTEGVYDNTIDGDPIIEAEPVIHPGGSQSVDYQKVQTIGVESVVQAASAGVPDQSHPEKYLNHNHDLLHSVVEHNLWRKQTKALKHHHHHQGEKLKVIPHLAPGNTQ